MIDERARESPSAAAPGFFAGDSGAIAVLLLFHLYLFREIIFFGRFLFNRDITLYAYPIRAFVRSCILSGAAPFWDPHVVGGFPVIAVANVGLFYPFYLLLLPFALLGGLNILIFLHALGAGLAMYAFSRDAKLSPPASLVGALSFSGGAYLLGLHHAPEYLISGVWTPLALLCFRRALRGKGEIVWAVGIGAFQALNLLAGDVQTVYLTFYVLLAWGAARLFQRETGESVRKLALIGAVALAGFLAFSMVQILPTLKLLPHTIRAAGLEDNFRLAWSLHPARLVGLLIPHPFGLHFPVENTWGEVLDSNLFWSEALYPGALTLPLALTALLFPPAGERRTTRLLWLAALLSVLLSVGSRLPLHRWFTDLAPGFDRFRYPEKFLFFFFMALAYLAALGVENLRSKDPRGLKFFFVLTSSLAAVLLALWTVTSERAEWIGELERLARRHDVAEPHFIAAVLKSSFLWAGGVFLLAAVLAAAFTRLPSSGRRRAALLASLLALLVALDLSRNASLLYTTDRGFFDRPEEILKVLEKDVRGNPYRYLVDPALKKELVLPKDTPRTLLEESFRYRFQRLELNQASLFGLLNAGGFYPLLLASYDRIGKALGRTPYRLDVLSVRHLLYQGRKIPDGFSEAASLRDGFLEILRYDKAIPIVSLRGAAVWVKDPGAALAKIRRGEVDLRKTVILSGDSGETEEAPDREPEREVKGKIEILDRSPGRWLLDVTLDGPAHLVLNEALAPGWEARVGGKEERIRRANGFGMAVSLISGRHEVEFEYRPPGLAAGALTSGAAWLLLSAWVLYLALRRRRAGRRSTPSR